jgi:hypothetical protein
MLYRLVAANPLAAHGDGVASESPARAKLGIVECVKARKPAAA